MVKIYNISVPKKYTKNGTEKTAWNTVGKLVKFEPTETKPEGFILELSMFPDTKFGVFEQKNKPENNNTEQTETGENTPNVEGIPF